MAGRIRSARWILAACWGCASAHGTPAGTTPAERQAGEQGEMRDVSEPFDPPTRRALRWVSGLERQRTVVRDSAAWATVWARTSRGGAAPLPPVDFARHMVIVVAMGRQASGGYVITIDSVTRATDGTLLARVTEEEPGPRCGTAAMITSPADISLLPRTAAPVRFIEHRVMTIC